MSYCRSAEIDMLATDLERANQRVIMAERQLENYKRLIERNQDQSSSGNRVSNTNQTQSKLAYTLLAWITGMSASRIVHV